MGLSVLYRTLTATFLCPLLSHPTQLAIVLGVVGGIVVLALLALVTWLLARHRRAQRKQRNLEKVLRSYSISV